jgi:hypothetical protein
MAYNFINLTDEIRALMVEELEKDKNEGNFYLSQNFNDIGDSKCFEIAKNEILHGSEESFVSSLVENKCFDKVNKKGRTVPVNAAEVYAHNEFNRFYMRALAIKAMKNFKVLAIYRAKYSSSPRPESEALIGKEISAIQLLEDLRNDSFIEKALGLGKPNSGLSVRLVDKLAK